MRPLWVRRVDGGEWVHLNSVADAVTHLKTHSTDIFHTQVTRAASKGGTAKGWEFSFEDPQADPRPTSAASAPRRSPTSMSSFFCPTSALPACACCGDKPDRDVTTCTNCKHKVHALCTQGGRCFKCVCRVCNEPPGGDMRACKTCVHRVHTTCAVHMAFHVEVVCKQPSRAHKELIAAIQSPSGINSNHSEPIRK